MNTVNPIFNGILDAVCPTVERDMRPIVEVSEDQNTVTVTTRLDFVATRYDLMQFVRCNNCRAKETKLCNDLPCMRSMRKDEKYGYFVEVRT